MSDTFDFNEEEYKAFKKHLENDFIKILVEMDGGYSGARTSIVQVEAPHSVTAMYEEGKYILKVCLSKDAVQEIEKHLEAKTSTILDLYVPDLIKEPIRYENNETSLTGILYQIAGESLLYETTLRERLKQRNLRPAQMLEKLASTILDWNLSTRSPHRTTDLLEVIMQDIGEKHLEELDRSLKGIGNYPRIDFTFLHSPMYNPIYFLYNMEIYIQTPLRQMAYNIPRGNLHGDLHPGNVIVSSKEEHYKTSFYLIDFASSHLGNAFFDLAYLELSILLNSRGGFDRMLDVENWWELEQYLFSAILPSESKFRVGNREDLQRVLPIRRALAERIKRDGKKVEEDYWVAFLAASVEAGLELTRKIYRNPALQRIAFLTAISRFQHLVELLKAFKKPLSGAVGTIDWPDENLEMEELSKNMEKRKENATQTPNIHHSHKHKTQIELVWPAEITMRDALYDPWRIVDEIWNDLTRLNDQGILLIGERRFGKSSFFNCINGLFPNNEGNIRAVRLDTLSIKHSLESFANELLRKMCRSIGLQNSPIPFSNSSKDFDFDSFIGACQSVANEKSSTRFVILIDEIDNTLVTATSEEDARSILRLLFRLLTDLSSFVRLLLTASDKEILRGYRTGTGFVDNLRSLPIPLCSIDEMKELIEKFEVPLTFDDEALKCIYFYSGGQIYFIKLAVKLALSIGTDQADGIRQINGQTMNELLKEVIEPTSKTGFAVKSINGDVFPTMKNIYSVSFSDDEKQFIYSLTRANGILRISNTDMKKQQLKTIANLLYDRGYLYKKAIKRSIEYSWRIGIWQLYLENFYHLNYPRKRMT